MSVVEKLVAALGHDVVLTDGEALERYRTDWSSEVGERPAAVLRPRTTAEISSALAICHEHHQPVCVQGGLTGLSGGAVPRPGEITLSLERLNGIEEFDKQSMTMTVLAGTPL